MSSILDDDGRINSLPDHVLCHILTFLKTKEVFATSVLSKRWIDLWRSVPAFIFIEINVHNRETDFRLNELAYSFLLSVDSIKNCYLDILYYDLEVGHLGFPNVIKWINAVVKRGVESIRLLIHIIPGDHIFKLPISILTCLTLVVLKLYGFIVKDFSSIRLPSLKTLSLDEIIFVNDQDFFLLLAGCPNLEDLCAICSKFLCEEFLPCQERESLTLNKLIKAHLSNTFCDFPLKALRNAEHLVVEINEVFHCCDEIPTFHNLTYLELCSMNCNWNFLFQMLKQCPNLQNVLLCQYSYEEIKDVEGNWVEPTFVPQCLSLLKTCQLEYFSSQEGEYLLAKYILKNARVLQTMTILCRKDLKINRKLYSCPKASAGCKVIVKLTEV